MTVLGSEYPPLLLEYLAPQFFRFLEAPFERERAGQISHRNQCVGVLRPENAALTFQRPALNLFRLGITSLLDKGTAQSIHRTQGFGIPSSARSAVNLDGSLQQRLRTLVKAEIGIDIAHRMHHLRPKFGVFLQTRIDIL